MTSDRIFGAVMIVVALGYILSATPIQLPLFPDPMGPKMFPFLVAGGVIICALVMILRPDAEADWPPMSALLTIGAAACCRPVGAWAVGRALRPLSLCVTA